MSLGEASASDTLADLQGKGDKYTKLSIIERKRLSDLEDAISYVMKETNRYREVSKKSAIEVMNIHVLTPNPAYQRADGINIGKEAQAVTSKTLIVLEAKLNKLLQRKSDMQNKIKKMKENINHFRLLRLQTDINHAKFEAALAETKEKIENYLADSTKVVEERERLLEKKDALERLNREEQTKFTEEYEEMGRFVEEQNDALEDALLQERKQDRKAMAGKGAGKIDPATVSPENVPGAPEVSALSLEEELEMAKKVGSLNSYVAAEQNSLSDLHGKIAAYERMFDQLKNMTGVESLDDMVSNYIAHEEEMFSLYNFIQTINTEIDAVVESTAQTEADIAKYREEQQDQDQERKSTIDELQQRLAATLEATRELEQQNQQHIESVTQICKKVSTLFFKLQCDQMDAKGSQVNNAKTQRWATGSRPDNKIALLTGQSVTASNVIEYLGCIEQRAVDIISDYLRATNGKHMTGDGRSPNGGGPRSPTPGPSTPMNWRGNREPLIDLADLSDDEFLDAAIDRPTATAVTTGGTEGFGLTGTNPPTMGGILGQSNPMPTTPMAALPAMSGAAENDSKPIDLNVYKSKLQRKLGVTDAGASTNALLFRKSASMDER